MAAAFRCRPVLRGSARLLSGQPGRSAATASAPGYPPADLRMIDVSARYECAVGDGTNQNPARPKPASVDPAPLRPPVFKRDHFAGTQLRPDLAQAPRGNGQGQPIGSMDRFGLF